jgi:hypothetical protein
MLINLDLCGGESGKLFVLAAAILSLGGVYWLVRDRKVRDSQWFISQFGEVVRLWQPPQ